MFGYVTCCTDELKMREYRAYRALYCGLCKRMGACTGQCSRLSLNYDFVFLAAVRLSLVGEPVKIRKARCLLHPFQKRDVAEKCDTLDYVADASLLLTYRKLADDKRDERGSKKLLAYLARPVLSFGYRRARRRHPELDAEIGDCLAELEAYESGTRPITGAVQLAEEFGRLMAAVFCEGLSGNDARIAASLGKALGCWLYLADAADDFEEDLRKHRFNPLPALFGETLTEEDRETLRLGLFAHLHEAERAYLLIDRHPSPEWKAILDNILYLGLPAATERVTGKKPAKKYAEKERKE